MRLRFAISVVVASGIAIAGVLVAGGCGLSLVGSADDADASDAAALSGDASPSADSNAPIDSGEPVPSDGGGADAGDGDGGLITPDPTKVTVSYSGGKDKKMYRFDVVAKQFTALKSDGCPAMEETAVMSDGSVYVTSSDGKDVYTYDSNGCTLLKKDVNPPFALGTAPKGTYSQTEETLVGYRGADYMKIDRVTGVVTTITAGALGALTPSGDMTAIGGKGYLSAAQGSGNGSFACATGGDCIVEINLVDGKPIKLIKQFPGLGIYGLAHSQGVLLFYVGAKVTPFNPITLELGASIGNAPGGADFSGAGAAPF